MRNTKTKGILASALAGLALAATLVGCQAPEQDAAKTAVQGGQGAAEQAEVMQAGGTLLLSVNPEIEIEYDGQGKVTEIDGINGDGDNVVSGYTGYLGRDAREVVAELVTKIYESGYFNQTVDGHDRNIVIKLEQGSAYLGDEFLAGIETSVRDTVNGFNLASDAITVAPEELDDQGYIGLDAAKEIVLAQLGLDEASFTERDYDLDDGVYELEFVAGGVEYEYEVDARTGKVLEADIENNDDWDDRDDADDWDDDRYDDADDWDDDHDDWDDQDDADDWDDDQDDWDNDDDDWDDDRYDYDDDDDRDDADDQDDWDDDQDDWDDDDDDDDDDCDDD